MNAVTPQVSAGWGGEGHQVVALIAERHLTAEARAQIIVLLGDAAISDAEIASWADEIRRSRRRTAPWHYVNVPLDAEGYDSKRDDPDGNHIVARMEKFEAMLADRSQAPEARAEALKFLVHLIGDLHQPLHTAERDGDRGGNLCRVRFLDRKAETNLHRVWDTDLLRQYVGRTPIATYADGLDDAVTDESREMWRKGSAGDWTTESWRLARDEVYAHVPAEGPTTLDDKYVERNRAIVEEQLARAGIRLAEVLNRSLAAR